LGREFWLEYVLAVMVFLAVLTIINRARRGLLEAKA